jgi:hypothetical protein
MLLERKNKNHNKTFSSPDSSGESIFEFYQIGRSVPTGIETSTITPSSISQMEIKSVALDKLRYVLNKGVPYDS